MFGFWSPCDIAQVTADALAARAASLDREQAILGLDALTETDLHPFLAHALSTRGYQTLREWPYPTPSRPRPLPRDRERCDLVVLPPDAPPPLDPVAEAARASELASTLFAAMPDPTPSTPPEDLFWLEVKLVGQHTIVDGAARANPSYASELVAAGRDLDKLARDPRILSAGLLLVLFTQDEATAHHDLDAARHRWLDKSWPAHSGPRTGFALTDRIANAWCAISLTPTRAI